MRESDKAFEQKGEREDEIEDVVNDDLTEDANENLPENSDYTQQLNKYCTEGFYLFGKNAIVEKGSRENVYEDSAIDLSVDYRPSLIPGLLWGN